ncbi:hypothetical protein EZJ19_09850 [Parasulfuritortus cantonensis]|uniref:Uncharacterized protein n=1 Tax=Parasulfuritortus cantonensis TaxID=2528202 RepID=A0A4R1BA68_9PROT|nr:hypothetical protein [Parasulfuritortus cantonensis]TCJ13830.1 hypothetical protein EZJ19_09850 [Parasulfuritortus cantonensis]
MKDTPSVEFLNAFVDGELAAGERQDALARLGVDPDFKAAVCELRVMKELVRGAYAEPPAGRRGLALRCPPAWRQALVAGLLLLVGLSAGWFARGLTLSVSPGPAPLAGLPAGYQAVALTDRVDADHVVLHLDSGDPTRLAAVLDLAERLLDQRAGRGRIEIVANSHGLDLLRRDLTPYRARIAELAERHANLSFLACGQTLARLRQAGVDVVLVPEAGVASSAVNEIITRMSQGWVYVKV